MHLPYSQRHWKGIDSEFFYIQPFADLALPTQLVELILDNNAFIKATSDTTPYLKAAVIPEIKGCGVNPSLALTEQWISNPDFVVPAKDGSGKLTSPLLEDFLKVSKTLQVQFSPDYVNHQLSNLKAQEKDVRRGLGILFAYLAVIRSIQQRKQTLDERLRQFKEFTSQDIPVFNGLICLAVLTFYAQANRAVLIDNDKQLISTIDSFYQPKDKEENRITPGYLRNRAADLWMWYFMAFLYQGKNLDQIFEGGTPIVVTGDKFIAAIPFRFIPPKVIKTISGTHFEFRFSPDGLPPEHQNKLIELCNAASQSTSPDAGNFDQERKLENMFEQTIKMLDTKDQPGFKEAWKAWVGSPAVAT